MPRRRAHTGARVGDFEQLLGETEQRIARVKDYEELENLESAYGYYLDKNLWNDLSDLFAHDGSMELAQRGVYKGQDHVRAFLLKVFGRGTEGPVAGRLGNHLQLQPVIDVADDGRSAKIRVRLLQQMSFGSRASIGAAVYENEAVKEDGVWRFKSTHAYNTLTAGYEGGWARNASSTMPGPSTEMPPDAPPTAVIAMFPVIYDIPFHYPNPVTGNPVTSSLPPGGAPSAGMPAGIAAALRDIGPKVDGPKTAPLYAPLQPKEPYGGITLVRDIAYGPHERQVLDVFRSSGGAGRPVVVFIYGGGFTRGAKHTPGSPFYDNVGLWAANHGLTGVTINYRLAPQFQWPAGIEDLTLLMTWLKAHVAEYGGDPGRIFLWGHSSGAAHVADYLAHQANTGADSGIAGAILTSGFYELGDKVSVWKDYYGEDISQYPARSSLPGLLKTSTPLLVTYAELDPELFQVDARRLIEARAQGGRPVRSVRLAGHSHLSETYAVGTGDESLSAPVLDFIRSP
jgi:triacylglycerol lipase